jgi:hypothetical protein
MVGNSERKSLQAINFNIFGDFNVNHLLKFVLDTGYDDDLIVGTLQLLADGKVINTYQATSSFPGNQKDGSWNQRGGLLPPNVDYQVATNPLQLNIKGVADGDKNNFYQISPFELTTATGTERGDWGIHWDGNAPGTLGCIGLETRRGWLAFQRDMVKVASIAKKIPLKVIYI